MSLPSGIIPTVLIASDDETSINRLSCMLDARRYPTEVVHDGREALRLLTGGHPPFIALLDAALPELSGFDILSEMRRLPDRHPTWTMLLSDHVRPEEVRMAADAGADDVLLKPVDETELHIRLRVAERIQALTSQLTNKAEAVRYHATHDGLTGLWNREALLSLLFQETDRVQRMKTSLTFLLLDLDNFSQVNLEYGYDDGDRILSELSARFRRFLRSYDLVGRYGEDEFLIALPGRPPINGPAMAARIQQSVLQKPFSLPHGAVTLKASIGVAESRGRSPLVVLREVERALAEAKLGGKNCIRSAGAAHALSGEAARRENPIVLRLPVEAEEIAG